MPKLQSNTGPANGGERLWVNTDATVQIYLEGKCSISWAF